MVKVCVCVCWCPLLGLAVDHLTVLWVCAWLQLEKDPERSMPAGNGVFSFSLSLSFFSFIFRVLLLREWRNDSMNQSTADLSSGLLCVFLYPLVVVFVLLIAHSDCALFLYCVVIYRCCTCVQISRYRSFAFRPFFLLKSRVSCVT